ncbi:MAG: insulinase family protein [Pyrinomonadaceae bacterium]|nr:insulinase family protein [Pyrinomonadaceae bacterium]MCX7640839.1 insulinase family protein [Pyrinomonadaceae bacterium]MDW8303396.1 pitrilysin family protein [Acidobacteriota bacterium]
MKAKLVVLFAFSLFISPMIFGQKKASYLPPIKYEEYRLDNGLRVIMHVDRSVPIVAVNVWYHVGSKNEVPGRTGFAHLFEHLMFQGSKNYDDDYFKPLQEAGATINGTTNADRTNYFQVLPSNFLELALFMEADRMGGLLEAMTQEKLDNQRDVVKNERRQRYDNQPYGTAFEKISELMYPKNHPYSWTTIGSLKDLTEASMEDVKNFFRTYYVPNNASLVIAGDFDPKQAKKWVEKYFGPIPRGNDIVRPNPPQPKLEAEIRKSFEDAVRLPRIYMVWHTVPQADKDSPALDILATILSSGRGSRLQSKLVFDKQVSQDVFASHISREIAGLFQIVSTARPGKQLEEIEKEINEEIEKIKKEPPTREELERALNQIEARIILGLQTVLAKADAMNENAVFYGKPDRFQEELEEYLKVTPEDISRVANKYLIQNRLVMSIVPGKKKAPEADQEENKPTSTSTSKKENKKDFSANLPKPGPDPKFSLPKIEKQKLSNGLEVWFVKHSELPIVSMNMVFRAGADLDPIDRAGLAVLTSDLIDNGTKTRSAVEIANQLQSLGTNLVTSAGWDSSNLSMLTLKKNLDKALEIFSDVLINPSFPQEELETVKRRMLVSFLQRKDDPNQISNIVYSVLLYGKNHPYGKPINGDETTIKAITREEIQKFYETYYRPNNAVLIVVGDTSLKEIVPKLEKAFAGWKAAEIPRTLTPPDVELKNPGIYIVDRPGAAQSVISIGHVGVSRSNPDYIPLVVMNSILGGQFTSRVNLNLREDKGYTYGARTSWSFRRGAGPFEASAAVQTAVTKGAVVEFLKEINGILGERPVTSQELEYNKQSIIRRYPQGFETVGQIANQLATLAIYNLPDNYFNEFLQKVKAVTIEDINRVAKKYIQPDKMAILIVGDRKVIEPELKKIQGWGEKISYLDTEGNPLKVDEKTASK